MAACRSYEPFSSLLCRSKEFITLEYAGGTLDSCTCQKKDYLLKSIIDGVLRACIEALQGAPIYLLQQVHGNLAISVPPILSYNLKLQRDSRKVCAIMRFVFQMSRGSFVIEQHQI